MCGVFSYVVFFDVLCLKVVHDDDDVLFFFILLNRLDSASPSYLQDITDLKWF